MKNSAKYKNESVALHLFCSSEELTNAQITHRQKQIANLLLLHKSLGLPGTYSDVEYNLAKGKLPYSEQVMGSKFNKDNNNGNVVGKRIINGNSNASTSYCSRKNKRSNGSENVVVTGSISLKSASSTTQSLRATRKSTGSLPPSKVRIVDDDPEIEFIQETKSSTASSKSLATKSKVNGTQSIQAVRNQNGRTQQQNTKRSSTGSENTANSALLLLNVFVRPKNVASHHVNSARRKDLDSKVKVVLMKSSPDFVEWLLKIGLIRRQQFCAIHKGANGTPFPLKLGLFSDTRVLASSGGYMWIGECCGKKYISVYSGSIFGSTPIEKVPPSSVLKLIYHWSCQTSISNVETWVKVNKRFIARMYHYFRCVCSIMLHERVFNLGSDGTHVELGIVSLGTTTADGSRKAVKVEILGLYDRKTKNYRLFASTPEPSNNSRERFMRILKPLRQVVHSNAKIICDQSIDPTCLNALGYLKVEICYASDDEKDLSTNSVIMYYLRKHVPKMFQASLSQLSEKLIQLALDELCWREKYASTAASCYDEIIDHITYITIREIENHGLLPLLEFVAEYPHNNFRYKKKVSSELPTLPILPSSVILSPTSSSFTVAASQYDVGSSAPISMTNKIMMNTTDTPAMILQPIANSKVIDQPQLALSPFGSPLVTTNLGFVRFPQGPSSLPTNPPVALSSIKVSKEQLVPQNKGNDELLDIDPYFYGNIIGDKSLGQEYNDYIFKCHICSEISGDNVEFYSHMKGHLNGDRAEFMCSYCTRSFLISDTLKTHEESHRMLDNEQLCCRLCRERFSAESNFKGHMSRKHVKAEMPYRCDVCNFATSFYYEIIDHFTNEHRRTPYVMCHYCLAVRTLTPAGAKSFSYRIYTHLQKHNHRINCKSCELTFYSNYILNEHKKDHLSASNVDGYVPYIPPKGYTCLQFKPVRKNLPPSTSTLQNFPKNNKNSAMSFTVNNHKSVVLSLMKEEQSYICFECLSPLNSPNHFDQYRKCTRCVYHTSCQNMIVKHSQVFHPVNSKKPLSYNLGAPVSLPFSLFCKCGFDTLSGHHMAGHLALCALSNGSAYPNEDCIPEDFISSIAEKSDAFDEDYSDMPLSVEIDEQS